MPSVETRHIKLVAEYFFVYGWKHLLGTNLTACLNSDEVRIFKKRAPSLHSANGRTLVLPRNAKTSTGTGMQLQGFAVKQEA